MLCTWAPLTQPPQPTITVAILPCGLVVTPNAGNALHPAADEEEITSPGNRFARQGVPEDVVCGYRVSRRAAFHAETAAECAHVLNEPLGDASLADTIPE
jgi:hypothetical protein